MTLCSGCPDQGMCCRYIELPIQFTRRLTEDEVHWVNLHPGFEAGPNWVTAPFRADPVLAHPGMERWNIACSALAADGTCQLFDRPERPEMCSRSPDGPNQTPDGCLYNDALTSARAEVVQGKV